MSFTYTPENINDITRVRFAIGDTVEGENFLSDEEIMMTISEANGDWKRATLACITFIISRLSQPNFTADWLTVDNKSAREGFERMLLEKRKEFGIRQVATGGQAVYRSDSLQTAPGEDW